MADNFVVGDPHAVILHNMPFGSEFGIDYSNWYIGHRFCGINSIPNGFHFIYSSNVDRDQQHSPRNGLFLLMDEAEKYQVFRSFWDGENKEIDLPIQKISRDNVSDVRGKQLAPYPIDEKYNKWKSLTKYITRNTLDRISPGCGRLNHMTQVDCTAELDEREKLKLNIKSGQKSDNALLIRFTAVPTKLFPDGASPADITKCSLDQSYALECMLDSFQSSNAEEELLAELQFAFVCFMIGQVYDAFEHWKTVIRLICGCDEVMYKRPEFFIKFLDLLKLQLEEIPQDFFVDIVAQQNFLVKTLQVLFSTLQNSRGMDPRLKVKGNALETFLVELFDWSFDFEDDEDLPVVVET